MKSKKADLARAYAEAAEICENARQAYQRAREGTTDRLVAAANLAYYKAREEAAFLAFMQQITDEALR